MHPIHKCYTELEARTEQYFMALGNEEHIMSSGCKCAHPVGRYYTEYEAQTEQSLRV
ncbi:MAG: hypothetical protein Hyperionvirus10_25 [Hyperionvirus sp.]|uniref:Uncharacterized protein n=1 Tax=Hyperionvirus sp. TaxID=2487770 RepID=A0A3G5AE92_9VIRU|nr:MAG: hypothetical protein Hyperionvirus10_25 [Hyperionvirus sp.]